MFSNRYQRPRYCSLVCRSERVRILTIIWSLLPLILAIERLKYGLSALNDRIRTLGPDGDF